MRNPVIPVKKVIYNIDSEHKLDLKAICLFAASGFFIADDTYWLDEKVVPPGHEYSVDGAGKVMPGSQYFKWQYAPRNVSFVEVVEEFTHLLETITREQCAGKNVILPLSGGLDSRSQAVALKAIGHRNVKTYSYGFEGSFDETYYGKRIAKECGYPFVPFTIPKNYLWNVIQDLAEINDCYSEFTHPRQMAVINDIAPLGDMFFLGHWGDVLFDSMGVTDDASDEAQLAVIKKSVVKKGGLELANALWEAWGLEGTFEKWLDERLANMLSKIDIKNANARVRAFKTMNWAPRWTSENLAIFSLLHPIELPYYDQRMCEFISRVPEEFLADRKIQIEYIKLRSPGVAKVEWQTYHPRNLFDYQDFGKMKYMPARAFKKAKRIMDEKLFGKRLIIRNWENQFLGRENEEQLKRWLFENNSFSEFIPQEVTRKFYDNFKNTNDVYYSHPVSMLLTLSLFADRNL